MCSITPFSSFSNSSVNEAIETVIKLFIKRGMLEYDKYNRMIFMKNHTSRITTFLKLIKRAYFGNRSQITPANFKSKIRDFLHILGLIIASTFFFSY